MDWLYFEIILSMPFEYMYISFHEIHCSEAMLEFCNENC